MYGLEREREMCVNLLVSCLLPKKKGPNHVHKDICSSDLGIDTTNR